MYVCNVPDKQEIEQTDKTEGNETRRKRLKRRISDEGVASDYGIVTARINDEDDEEGRN